MIKYVLNYYDGSGDEWTCYESEDQNEAVSQALSRSLVDGDRFTYRLDKWENGERVLKNGFRFFENGREVTHDWLNELIK